MEKFKPTVIAKEFITAASDALVTQNALVFNDGVGSSTILTDDQALNNNYKNSQSISKDVPTSVSGYKNVDTNTIVANVKISNKTLSADVRISTILIYASYNGNNILAATARLNAPELLPAYDTDKGTPVTLEFAVYMQVSNNINAPVQFNEAGLATSADLRTVDASAVHKSGDETIDGIKKFLKPINGTAEITIHYLWDDLDLNTLVENSVYVANNVKVLQSSVKENFIMRVEAGNSKFPVKQTKYSFDTGMTYVRYQNDGSWTNFIKQPTDDSVLVHLFGDETIDGNKTFLKNIATTSDNSMINGGGNDKSLALVKQSGTQPFVAFGNNNQVQIKKSNNTAINPTDTFRTILNITDNGQVNVGNNQDLVPLDKNVAHKSGDEIIDGNKKFLNPISGSLLTRAATFTDFADVAANMKSYNGNWFVGSDKVLNGPNVTISYEVVEVICGHSSQAGIIKVTPVGSKFTYYTIVNGGTFKAWYQYAQDETVVHNTGDETVSGDKTFTGTNTFNKKIIAPAGVEGPIDLSQIKVGGRNLMLGTADWSGGSSRWNWRASVTNNTYRGTVIAATSKAFNYTPVYQVQNAGILKVGKTYTFSTYIRNTSDTDTKIGYYYSTDMMIPSFVDIPLPAHTDWTRIFVTFQIIKDPTTNNAGLRWESKQDVTNGEIQVAGYKLEEGNVPTDWTPAPEDAPSNDAQLVHNTGNETVAGDKTFTGTNTFNKKIIAPAGVQGPIDNTNLISAPAFQSLQTQVNNSAVGTNIYTNTKNFDDQASWGSLIGWTTITDSYKGLAVLQTNQPWGGLGQYIQVKKGDVLTYSVYAKYASGTGTGVILWDVGDSYSPAVPSGFLNNVTITDSWQRLSGTAVATSDGYLRPRLNRTDKNTNTLQIAGIKVEKGTIATDWCPAPEDVPSNDSNLVHKTGDESLDGIKTFLKKIQGSITNADVADVRTNSISDNQDISKITTSGYYAGRNVNNVQGIPSANFNGKYFDLTVWVTGSNGFMFIVDDSDHMYFRKRQNSVWLDYKPMPLDATKLPRNDRQETIHETWKFEKDIDGTANYSKQPVLFDIADGTDLNNIKTSGSYSCGTNRVGNAPINNWFSLVVVQNGLFNGVQTLTDTNNGEVYTRTWNNSGSWFSPWEKLSSDSKVVHNSGNETIYDKKTFDAVTTFNNGIVNKPISMNGFKIDVSKLVSGTYNVWQGDISGCPADYGIVEVFENVSNTMYRFTQTNLPDVHVWIQLKNSGGFTGWKQQM